MSKDELSTQKTGALVVPDFMDGDAGTESLGQYVIPPRLKVVQKQSGDEFTNLFDPGAIVIVPQMLEIALTGVPFHFVPIFFFAEWCLWNPIDAKGTLPAIRARTLDPNSAMVAKSRNPALWEEEIDGYKCKYCEHFNFVISLIGESEFSGMPMVMSFARAEHKSGANFASLLKMRKAPIYGCQFEASSGQRSNNKGSWFGIDVSNPSKESLVHPFVQDKDTYEVFETLYKEYKQAHEDSKIQVDYEGSATEETTDSPTPF